MIFCLRSHCQSYILITLGVKNHFYHSITLLKSGLRATPCIRSDTASYAEFLLLTKHRIFLQIKALLLSTDRLCFSHRGSFAPPQRLCSSHRRFFAPHTQTLLFCSHTETQNSFALHTETLLFTQKQLTTTEICLCERNFCAAAARDQHILRMMMMLISMTFKMVIYKL